MTLSIKEQVINQIRKSESILICIGKNYSGDSLGSAIGLCLAVKKTGKRADIVSQRTVFSKYSFLEPINLITNRVGNIRDYILSVDIERDMLHQLRYETKKDKLKIFITAKNGSLKENNFSFEPSKFGYDLIVILGASDLEDLGNIYNENAELFYESPIVNIDHSTSNEHFGKINFVDAAASSTSEIIFNLISDYDEKLIDKQIATSLLMGIILETNSFQNKNTTPKAFLTAASLIDKGADRQEIIKNLYRTKSISVIKLMGKIMYSLKYNSRYKIGWSVVDNGSSDKIRASTENMSLVARELINSSPEFELLLLLYKENDKIKGIINFEEKLPIFSLSEKINGSIENEQLFFTSKEDKIGEAEVDILKKIKTWFDKNIHK